MTHDKGSHYPFARRGAYAWSCGGDEAQVMPGDSPIEEGLVSRVSFSVPMAFGSVRTLQTGPLGPPTRGPTSAPSWEFFRTFFNWAMR